MKILDNLDLCYGCGACVNACSKDAITMLPAADGFLYPSVNDSKCINCNLCKKVCPVTNTNFDNNQTPKVYAMMASDEIREKSASGGMFSLLAEYAFERKGYVVGAAFTEDFLSTKLVMIDNPSDLDRLRRSKYIQCDSGDIYRQVKEKLDEGRFVLFTGTPCQCAALKSFLRKPYDNLFIADLICHGTPSSLVWQKFLEENIPNKKISDVNFRYKGLIGWSSTLRIEFEDGSDYTELSKKCAFQQAFQKNLISRKSCGTCQFARVPRQGDLTIGDFWDVHKYKRALDDRKGTSSIIVNSAKGQDLLNKITSNYNVIACETVPFYDAFARRNSNVYRASPTHPGREIFFKRLGEGEKFSKALNSAKAKRFDVMLFGIWYGGNYGSVLTNFALYKFLEDSGYNCLFADIPDHLWPDSVYNRDPLSMPHKFCLKHFKLSFKYKNRVDLKKVNDLADAFIVGSDQLWNYPLCRTAETFFYLDFIDEDKKKIAYGTSFGHKEIKGTAAEKRFSGFYLNRFDAVSVREDYAVDLCRDGFGVDAVQVLDPVFMCDRSHYEKCLEEASVAKKPSQKRFVLAYILDPTDAKLKGAQDTAKRMGLELICVANARMKGSMETNWKIPKLDDLAIEDWLWYFKNAEMVYTDSFHGTCFSIIFEKPFIAISNKGRGSDRFFSLAGLFNLENRVFNSPEEAEGKDYLFDDVIDYNDVNIRMAAERERSLKWVREVLDSPMRPMAYSAYDVTERHLDNAVKQLNGRADDLKKQLDALIKDSNDTTALVGIAVDSLATRIDKVFSSLEKQKNLIEESNRRQASREEEIQQITTQVKKLNGELLGYKERLSYMENSLSWKVTKPLRWMASKFHKK